MTMHRISRHRSARRVPARRAACFVAAALVAAGTLLLAATAALAAETPLLFQGNEGVAVGDGASGLFFNPALAGVRYRSELLLALQDGFPAPEGIFGILPLGGTGSWPGAGAPPGRFDRRFFGALNLGGLGFGGSGAGEHVDAWFWSLGGGPDELRAGLSATSLRDRATGGRRGDWRAGLLSRPAPWLSIGAVADHVTQPEFTGARLRRDYTLGLGVRPWALMRPVAHTWGTRLTLSADLAWREGEEAGAARPRVAGELELLPGLVVRGSAQRGGVQAAVGVNLLHVGLNYLSAQNEDGEQRYYMASLSVHPDEERTVLAGLPARRVVQIRAAGDLADERLSGFSLLGGAGGTPVAGLHRALNRALEDPLTQGVLLDVRDLSGMAQVEELRPLVAKLRAAGKPVVAYLEYGTGRAGLYLASACDRIVASEEAMFLGLGLRAERRYYRRMLEDWGIAVDRASWGKYKSAYRNFSADSTPPADREVIERNLDVDQELFVAAVCGDRKLERATLAPVLEGQPVEVRELQERGIVDSVGYREDALRVLGGLCGLGKKPRVAGGRDLLGARREWMVPAPVAVIYASGAIETGRSGNDVLMGPYMGSETLARQIRRAFGDADVKAIVFRVESPGGSGLASDLIHHAVALGKKEHKKPFIVSMGAVAASGGYYISCNADRIYADRFTRTGSIGVLTVKPSIGGWYDKHHVRQESFDRGRWMGGWSLGRTWTPEEQAFADSSIQRHYRRFVQKVADGRGRSWASVDSVAQGRVWLGEDALQRGLVDEIGGLDAAVAEARRRAHIPAGEKIRLAEYRRPRPLFFERLAGDWVADFWSRSVRLPEPGEALYWDDTLEP
jgi:protease-4